MQLLATHYGYVSPFLGATGPVTFWVRHCLWCHWHEAHFSGGSNFPRSALMLPCTFQCTKVWSLSRLCIHYLLCDGILKREMHIEMQHYETKLRVLLRVPFFTRTRWSTMFYMCLFCINSALSMYKCIRPLNTGIHLIVPRYPFQGIYI